MKPIHFILFLLFSISCSVSGQIEVKTINPDGTPNNNCYFSTDSVQVGLTNREGVIFIDQSFQGKEFFVKELETGWDDHFVLNGDTSIVLEDIQILDEVKITPRNTKKLYKEIMELNQSQLPEKLNLKGEIFISKLYIINDLKSEERIDTVVDFFKCDIIILDVFGDKNILTENPRKYRKGYAENDDYFSEVESLSHQFYEFEESLSELLDFERFEMKKFRKYKSSFDIDESLKELRFFNKDTTLLLGESVENEFLYVWNSNDSLFNRVSRFTDFRGMKSSTVLNIPFVFTEFSNFNHDYSNSHILSERELTFFSEKYNKHVVNNVFSYFYIDKKVEADISTKGYKEVESLQDLFEETKSKKPEEGFTPILYPLKFPSSIFF